MRLPRAMMPKIPLPMLIDPSFFAVVDRELGKTGRCRRIELRLGSLLFDRCFAEIPDRLALWHRRCPTIPDLSGELPPILEHVITEHWFDPCELLSPDARSELRPEFRSRQAGGGWEHVESIATCARARHKT
jgi:hypothetical protein